MQINLRHKKEKENLDFNKIRRDSLVFYDKDFELKQIDRYYKNRISSTEEKLNKELEEWQDDFFNLSIAINEKKTNIENYFNKKIEQEESKKLLLKDQLLNLNISKENYEKQLQNLNNERAINTKKILENKKIKLDKTDNWFKKKEVVAKKHVYKLEKRFKEFNNSISKDSEKRYLQIEKKYFKIEEANSTFLKNKKEKLKLSLKELNEKTELEINNLTKDFKNNLIGLDNYQKLKNQKIKSYLKVVSKLEKQAFKPHPQISNQRLINKLFRIKEEDRLINYMDRVKLAINNSKLLIIFLFIAIITGALNTNFFSSQNWLSAIIQQNLFIGYIAIGETFVILTGGIDLSVGSLAGFGGTIYLSLTLIYKVNFVIALIITIIALVLIGFLNGLFVSKLKIPPFIITLAGLLTLSGAIKLVLNGVPLSNFNDPIFRWLNTGVIENSSFTNAILLFIIIVTALLLYMKFSRFSRYVYATGDNKNAAQFSGIKVNKILISVYTLSGFFAALGAISLASKTSSVDPNSGTGFELDAITAVALGGTSLSGGRGGVGKTIIGWFAISMLINSFSFLNLDSNVQLVAKGLIIVLAILFDGKYNLYNKAQKTYYKLISRRI